MTPGAVEGLAGTKALAVGHRHTCVIDAMDRVACWGRNAEGQLGSAGLSRPTPQIITQLGSVTQLSAAGRATCALDVNGTMSCWGDGQDGQLGTGSFESSTAPTAISLPDVRSFSMGATGGCAALRDGTAACWGTHDAGDGSHGVELVPAMAAVTSVADVSTQFRHSCAIAGGGLTCWGEDEDGQLGRGTRSIATRATKVPGVGVTQLAVGSNHVCTTSGDTVRCWGSNRYAESGGADLQRAYSPVTVSSTISPVERVVAAYARTCVVGGGAAQCWGRGVGGALGNGIDQRHQASPTSVNATQIVDVAIGGEHLCVRSSTNTVLCFGQNRYGQLGGAPTGMSLTGVQPNLMNVTSIAAGARHSCAIVASALYCWGHNENGQLGNGTTSVGATPTPAAVDGGAVVMGEVVEIGAGDRSTCARNASGSVFCWGHNGLGQLGDGTRIRRLTPTRVLLPKGRTATKLAVGPFGACARLDDGAVVCWGDGGAGQLADGSTLEATTPIAVPGFSNASAVGIGSLARCALVNDEILCAGHHSMLGNGDNSRSLPAAPAFDTCQ